MTTAQPTKLAACILALLLVTLACAQPYGGPDTLRTRPFACPQPTTEGILTFSDHSLVITGAAGGGFYRDLFAAHVDPYGNVLRIQYFGEGEVERGGYACATPDGGFALAATTYFGLGTLDLYRFDAHGDTLYHRNYALSPWQRQCLYTLCPRWGGGFLLGGYREWHYGPGAEGNARHILEVDSAGTLLAAWTCLPADTLSQWSSFLTLCQTADSGYALAGGGGIDSAGVISSRQYPQLIKLSAAGVTEFTRTYFPEIFLGCVRRLVALPDGYLMAGLILSPPLLATSSFLIRTDLAGDTLWTQTIADYDQTEVMDLQVQADSSITLLLSVWTSVTADLVPVLLRLSATGDRLWQRAYPSFCLQELTRCGLDWQNRHLFVSRREPGGGAVIVYTEPDSTLPLPDPVSAVIEAAPQDPSLLTAYPNPFNSTTQIRYTLPHAAQVSLTVYDVMGRR